jgi:hypothetical protein
MNSLFPVRRRYKRPEERWETLRAKIQAYASLLATQGELVLKIIDGNPYWYLRFLLPPDKQGHRRQRSVYVGRKCDEAIVARVRALLEGYREPTRQIKELSRYVRLLRSLNRASQAAAWRL